GLTARGPAPVPDFRQPGPGAKPGTVRLPQPPPARGDVSQGLGEGAALVSEDGPQRRRRRVVPRVPRLAGGLPAHRYRRRRAHQPGRSGTRRLLVPRAPQAGETIDPLIRGRGASVAWCKVAPGDRRPRLFWVRRPRSCPVLPGQSRPTITSLRRATVGAG